MSSNISDLFQHLFRWLQHFSICLSIFHIVQLPNLYFPPALRGGYCFVFFSGHPLPCGNPDLFFHPALRARNLCFLLFWPFALLWQTGSYAFAFSSSHPSVVFVVYYHHAISISGCSYFCDSLFNRLRLGRRRRP